MCRWEFSESFFGSSIELLNSSGNGRFQVFAKLWMMRNALAPK